MWALRSPEPPLLPSVEVVQKTVRRQLWKTARLKTKNSALAARGHLPADSDTQQAAHKAEDRFSRPVADRGPGGGSLQAVCL